jgi:levanase/levanbiose-producing levanase
MAVDGAARLVQQPVLAGMDAAGEPGAAKDLLGAAALELKDSSYQLPDAVPGAAQVIEAEIIPGTSGRINVRIFGNSEGTSGTVLGYDTATSRLTLDRTQSGDTTFHGKFASVESAPLVLDQGVLRLLVVVDHCSVEVFAQDGTVVMTDLVFPDAGSMESWLSVEGGTATVQKLAVSTLK